MVRDGRRLIAVVFGGRTARSRDAHMMDILNRSFTRVAQLDPPATPPLPPRKPNGLVQLAGIDEIVEAIVAGDEPPGAESAAAQQVSAAPEQGSASEWVSVAVPAPPIPPDSFNLAPSEQWAKGGYGVQVGAYRDDKQARRAATAAAAQAPHLLMHTHVRVSSIKGRQGPIYRARLVGLTREHAEEACRLLSHQGRDCLAVKIDTAVEIALNE